MSNMQGNPHVDKVGSIIKDQLTDMIKALKAGQDAGEILATQAAQISMATSGDILHAQATLALAFEQRTANLIAERDSLNQAYYNDCLNNHGVDNLKSLNDMIDVRLGLAE